MHRHAGSVSGETLYEFVSNINSIETRVQYIYRLKKCMQYRKVKMSDDLLKEEWLVTQEHLKDHLLEIKEQNTSHRIRLTHYSAMRNSYVNKEIKMDWSASNYQDRNTLKQTLLPYGT